MDIALLIVRLILAAIFGVAGTAKLLDLEGSEKAVVGFGVPKVLAKPVSIILPICEVLIAVSLLLIEFSWFGAIGGTALLLIFAGGMLFQISKGNAPDCHCFGQFHSEPVSPKSVIRNALFAVLGIGLIIAGPENQGVNLFRSDFGSTGNIDSMQIIIGLAIVGLLAAIIYFLKQISEQQVKILRRIEILEVLSSGERNFEVETMGHPEGGLPIGAPAPDFMLPDVKGKQVELNHLIADAKPMLFFFVSPNCSPCNALLPEIKEWQEELGEKFRITFVSSGSAKDNSDKFGQTTSNILLQKDKEISTLFGAVWTPTALLVNSDGTIGSRCAAGDEAIRSLIEIVKDESKEKDVFYIANGGNALQKSKIGEKIPEFAVEDLKGSKFGTEMFYQKPTLVAFWSETCPHCIQMLDDLREWDLVKGQDEPNLVLFSSGDVESHKKFDLKSPIILDEGYKIAAKLGMSGTPSAVLIGRNGEFISETAIGAPQIWALLGKKK
jgi:peroxiredoxin/uncharacterized membrane protein YphA (DoxX/SURF4 family)